MQNALNGAETANFEFPLYTKDGRRVEVLLNAATRVDITGKIVGVVGVGQGASLAVGVRQSVAGERSDCSIASGPVAAGGCCLTRSPTALSDTAV